MARQLRLKNVYVVGPQCTGKTTLVNSLEQHFALTPFNVRHPKMIREVARNVLKQYNFTREDITSSPKRALELQTRILEAQLSMERASSILSDDWYISDRSGIDPIVYAKVYVGEQAAEELFGSAEWVELEQRMKLGTVFLCETVPEWLIDDGTRLIPKRIEEWSLVEQTFRSLLDARGIHYTVVPRELLGLEQRVDFVVDATEVELIEAATGVCFDEEKVPGTEIMQAAGDE